MGLFSALLLAPLAPVRGVCRLSGVVLDAAEREVYDPAVVHARLAALNRAFDDGEIDDETFEREEEHLLDLLDRRAGDPRGPQRPGGT